MSLVSSCLSLGYTVNYLSFPIYSPILTAYFVGWGNVTSILCLPLEQRGLSASHFRIYGFKYIQDVITIYIIEYLISYFALVII